MVITESLASKMSKGKLKTAPRKRFTTISSTLSDVFLPTDWETSVSSDYLRYQIYDTLQSCTSYLRGSLSTAAFLSVGGTVNTALYLQVSQALSSVFTLVLGASAERFGREVKEWRLVADILNDTALTLELLLPYVPPSLVPCAIIICSLCRSGCGVIAGSGEKEEEWKETSSASASASASKAACIMLIMRLTAHRWFPWLVVAVRAVITAHFSQASSNLAEVQAKEASQETFATACSCLIGAATLSVLDPDSTVCFSLFAILTAGHVCFNYCAVASLALSTLNVNRATEAAGLYLDGKRPDIRSVGEKESIFSGGCLKPSRIEELNAWVEEGKGKGKGGEIIACRGYILGRRARGYELKISFAQNCHGASDLVGLYHYEFLRRNPNIASSDTNRLRIEAKGNQFVSELNRCGWRDIEEFKGESFDSGPCRPA